MGWRTHLGMGKYAHGGVHYLDLTDESRARQIQINKDTLARLDRMFEDTAKELAEKAARAGPDSLTRRWALDYEKEVRAVLANMRSAQFDITRDGMKKAAGNGTYVQHKVFSVIDEKYSLGLSERFTSVLSRVPEAALNEILSGKIYTDGAGLSKRIWRDTKGMENDIGYIIEQALLQKKSAVNLAADLEAFVNDKAVTITDWSKTYPGLYKTCSYEAQRLARTSINHAYQLSTVRAAKDNPYIDGLEWLSALSARTCNLCLSRHGWVYVGVKYPQDTDPRFFRYEEVPLDHPNGLCTLAPYIPQNMDEIAGELKAWANGKENPKLDKWLGKPLAKAHEKGYNSYKVIADAKDIPDWALNQRYSWSEKEIKALNYYTSHSFRDINGFLREQTPAQYGVKAKITDISKAIKKSTIQENITLWRGAHLENFEQSDFLLNVPVEKWKGEVLSDKAFSSTTMLKGKSFSGRVQMEILAPKGYNGAYIAPISDFKTENEMLLPKGQKFRIIQAEMIDDRYYVKVFLLEE